MNIFFKLQPNISTVATSSSCHKILIFLSMNCVRLEIYWDKKEEFVASVLIIFITNNNKGHKLKFVIPLFLEPDWVNL